MSSRQQVQQGSGSGGGGWPDVAPNFTYGAKTWVVGRPAAASPMHSGGIPDAYSLGAGSLPGGVTLDTVGGLISGTPNADGSGSQVVNGSNGQGANTGDGTLTWTVELAPVFTYPDPPTWPLDVAIVPISPTVSAGTVNTYEDVGDVLGGLGLSLNTNSGEISGTPSGAFSGDVTIRGNGIQGATYDYDIPVVIEEAQVKTYTVEFSGAGGSYAETTVEIQVQGVI